MKLIGFEDIKRLGIDPLECVSWVEEGLHHKDGVQLPPKMSVRPSGTLDGTLVNTMPCFVDFIGRGALRSSPDIPSVCLRSPPRFCSMSLGPESASLCLMGTGLRRCAQGQLRHKPSGSLLFRVLIASE